MTPPTLSAARTWLGLAGWLLLSFGTGLLGAVASVNAQGFYRQLDQPDWAPPPWLFGPVWTTLYIMMGIAAWLVWQRDGAQGALALYLAQLVLNALWTWIFFAWRRGALAFAEIVLLLLLIAATALAFWRVRPLAGLLLLPYLAWVAFATALTAALWRRNPGLL